MTENLLFVMGMGEVLEKCSHHWTREASWRWFTTREQAESFAL